MAGRLQHFVSRWRCITSDSYILGMVQHAHIRFYKEALIQRPTPLEPYRMNASERTIMGVEIAKLLQKGVITEIDEAEVKFWSNVFLRPKKDGSHRLILNLSKLNENVQYQKFKMETLESIISLMTPHCFMCSLDLKDAYYSVPVAPEHQKYLCFPWVDEGGIRRAYAFTCFPPPPATSQN